MPFAMEWPAMPIEIEFIVPQVRTKSSVAKQDIKSAYRQVIREASNGWRPDSGKQYVVYARATCSSQRANLPDIENVTKEIVDAVFPDDSVRVVKGIQMEAEVVGVGRSQERTRIRICHITGD